MPLINRASHYVRAGTPDGKHEEYELRQCSHCQTTWRYVPGSGNRRGVCLKCMGLLCGAPACLAGCAPFRAVTMEADKRFEMTAAGVYVKKGDQ